VALALGDVRVDLLDEGTFRLDGGALFRAVPRAAWARRCPPDAENRVLLALRPVLVRTPSVTALIDAGLGPDRRDAAFAARHDARPGRGLEALGVAPEQVDLVVLTHLHFDHAGGLLRPDGTPRFPRARVVVQRAELEEAGSDCALCRASYVKDDWAALAPEAVDGDAALAPGLRVIRTGGHTRGHQAVVVEGGGETLACWGDLVSTTAHLRPQWVTALDLYPMEAYAAKSTLLARAAREGWWSVQYHDPVLPLARLSAGGGGEPVATPP
jgi:glyoxylase-like metal-dependent hydrolase (beta-lactamase superfamily II)